MRPTELNSHPRAEFFRSTSGASTLAVTLIIGAIASVTFGVQQYSVFQSVKQIQAEQSRSDIQRKIESATNIVTGLIAAKNILGTGDANLIRYEAIPSLTSTGSCSTGGPNVAVNAGLWSYVPKSGTSNPHIDINLCHNSSTEFGCNNTSGESLKIDFESRDAANTNPDLEIVFGKVLYTAPTKSVGPKTAAYNLRMELSKGTLSGTNKCAIFIITRGSHSTNKSASSVCKIPNWGDVSPHYFVWQKVVPHPDLATAATWTGAPGASRYRAVTGLSYDNQFFAPCNRQSLYKCCANYKPAPLTIPYCGGQVLKSFTSQTPGVGTCGADCKCYLSVQISPLVIDFSGKGILFTQGLHSQIKFDMGAGPEFRTPWLRGGQEVAFLAIDSNHNGVIDSIHEMFGDKTILPDGKERDNGFLALGFYDENKDRVINSSDKIFNELLIWNDLNGDGKTNAGEILSAANNGIKSIDLNFLEKVTQMDIEGNGARYLSQIVLKDGSTRSIYDVYFAGGGSSGLSNRNELRPFFGRDQVAFADR